ncbi:response regulator transcription factor [Streptomyces sp. GMY02]|uniref:response regulator transcription factor n=1 Tax=Streptomyces sp. GMY02 TaxID=1333528 RepID=UPI001C2B8CCB|nr:response regulator transcription factor [Streptomyces sp. GMY02]QXE38496.1 response regulator transcription factor [Streptomyces sp. GMY02]
MSRVLVVEDEPQLARALEISLRARGYETDVAPDGRTALQLASVLPPDAVLLDLGLPDMSGIQVMKALRAWSRAPVLVVSARSTSDEKVAALDAGADDYITKPFAMEELLARLRAATRRADPDSCSDGTAVVTANGFTLDLPAKKAQRDGNDIRLTPTEWHLLEVLTRNRGRLVSRRQLLQEVWGPAHRTQSNYLRVHMAHLRRKLEADPAHPRSLITVPGMGYRFEV